MVEPASESDRGSGPPRAPSAPSAPPRRSRLRRWGRRLGIAAGVALCLALAFGLWLRTCFAVPPPLEGRPAILDAVAALDLGGRARLGASWFERRPGGSLLYLEGDPFTIGYANATLTGDLLEEQERSLIEAVRGFLPSRLSFWSVATLVLINNRNLPDYVPLEYLREVHGLALAGTARDPYPEFGPRYHRILNYHAAHDISHWVWDKPVLGCTSFAAGPAHTRDGRLLVGRNFDFEAGPHFDENKIIGLYRPTAGYAFLSVAWPGMAGAVTGINERRIYCSLNGAHSEDKGRIGTPVSLVVREVLQYAGDLEEAVRIVEEAQVFVSDSFLLACGETGRAVVVERSPRRSAVRAMEDGLLLQANHFEAPAFADDAGNLEYMRDGTSLARRARLADALAPHLGGLDPAAAVEVLRDRRGPGGAPLALGNRSAVNPMIATHAVVADVTAGVLWISRGPHQLGVFEPHTLEDFGGDAAADLPVIPADPALADGSYERLLESRELIARAREDPRRHGDALERALELNPGAPEALALLGQALEARGDRAGARARYREALAAQPPFRIHRAALEEALRRLGE